MAAQIILFINGVEVDTAGFDPCDPLVGFIRSQPSLKGTKCNSDYGCFGAGSVVMSSWNPARSCYEHRVIASGSTPLASTHRTNITTIEGIGTADSPHPLQTRLAECNGVQCGYDSPGIVVSMYGLLLNTNQPTMEEVEMCQVGNISRCNGYRSVLEAFKVFTEKPNNDRSRLEAGLPKELQEEDGGPVVFQGPSVTWHKVQTQIEMEALQKEEPSPLIVYGIPPPKDLSGFKTIIDISRMEKGARVISHEAELEIVATTTIEELVTFLSTKKAGELASIEKEMMKVLKSIKTPQFRAVTAMGDAVKSSVELMIFLSAANAKVEAFSQTSCKTFQDGNSEVLIEELLKNIQEVDIRSIRLPHLSEHSHLKFYSVAARKANASGSFFAAFKTDVVEKAMTNLNIFVGSQRMNETKQSDGMKFLEGKTLNDVDAWAGDISTNVTGETLIKNLILKFANDMSVISNGSPTQIKQLEEDEFSNKFPLSSTQFMDYGADAEAEGNTSPLGKPIPNIAGVNCATGQAAFTEDIPKLENELFFGLVASTVAHADLISIDPSEALKVSGVVKFISAKDIPDDKNIIAFGGIPDEVIFADKLVEYEGQPIGAVLAKSEKNARHAANLVKVVYKEKKPVVSLEEAMEANTVFEFNEKAMPKSFIKGDVETAFKSSDFIMEGSIKTTRQEHFYCETVGCLVVPSREDDEYKVYIPTQDNKTIQHIVAKALGVPFSRILVYTKRVGCSYGGKMARCSPVACAVAYAAKITGQPVRCHLTRDQDIRILGQRAEFIGQYKIGITDGKIMGAKYNLHNNGGWSTGVSPFVSVCALRHLDGAYAFPNLDAYAETYKTNTPSNTAFRAFGAPPSQIITENMIYDACVELGLDPVEFRKANFQTAGYKNHRGQVLVESDVTMDICMDTLLDSCNYAQQKKEVEEFNIKNMWKKRGLYALPNKFGVGYMGANAQANALVNIYVDGSVLISHGGAELGQGINTKMVQVVSHELGITMDKIRVSENATDKIPNPIRTGGSETADVHGNALKDACDQINKRLAPLREANVGASWEMIIGKAFATCTNISASGHYKVPDGTAIPGGSWYFTIGASCSLVEIDVLTGEHKLLSTNLIMDVGEAINPAIDVAQIEGAFIQGYGWISMEDTTFEKDGKLSSRGHDEYNLPTIADCPREFNVSLLRSNKRKPHILYSSKGIGEPPFFNGVSVYFAIKDAVLAARKDAGLNGKFSLKLPTTPSNVIEACAGDIKGADTN